MHGPQKIIVWVTLGVVTALCVVYVHSRLKIAAIENDVAEFQYSVTELGHGSTSASMLLSDSVSEETVEVEKTINPNSFDARVMMAAETLDIFIPTSLGEHSVVFENERDFPLIKYRQNTQYKGVYLTLYENVASQESSYLFGSTTNSRAWRYPNIAVRVYPIDQSLWVLDPNEAGIAKRFVEQVQLVDHVIKDGLDLFTEKTDQFLQKLYPESEYAEVFHGFPGVNAVGGKVNVASTKDVSNEYFSGFRYTTYYTQSFDGALHPHEKTYEFYGITHDRKFFIHGTTGGLIIPEQLKRVEEIKVSPEWQEEVAKAQIGCEREHCLPDVMLEEPYRNEIESFYTNAKDTDFKPTLSSIDELIESLKITP